MDVLLGLAPSALCLAALGFPRATQRCPPASLGRIRVWPWSHTGYHHLLISWGESWSRRPTSMELCLLFCQKENLRKGGQLALVLVSEIQNQTIMRPHPPTTPAKAKKAPRMVAGVKVGKWAPAAWLAEERTSTTFWAAMRLILYDLLIKWVGRLGKREGVCAN